MVLKLGENTEITSNWRRVKPGSIYFDFAEKRNRKELMQAYKNGASIIYTEKNISDPHIPVVKTDKLTSTFVELLKYHYLPDAQYFTFIAVTGSKGKKTVSNMLEHIFNSEFIGVDNYINSDNKKVFLRNKRLEDASYIENIYKSLKNYKTKNIKYIPVVVDTSTGFDFLNMFNLDLGILTNITTEDENEDLDMGFENLKGFYSSQNSVNTLILNIDDPHSLKILEKNKPMILITYGLNDKAAVNATSIDFGDGIYFNYSLQRSMKTISGKTIEAFEVPIKLKALGNYNIYNALAAITCALYYDIDIDYIRNALSCFNGLYRSLQKIKIGNFVLIDHCCINISDYSAAFDSIQTLDYKNIFIIASIDSTIDIESHKKICDIICQWSNALRVSRIILTGCMDYRDTHEFEGKKESKLYQRQLSINEIKNDYYSNLEDAINETTDRISDGDLLLILGGEELDSAQKTIYNIFNKKD